MYLHIACVGLSRFSLALLTRRSGPRPEGVAYAKQLCEELLEKVKTDYHAYKERPPPNRYGDREGYSGGRPGYGDRGDRGDRERTNSYGYGGGGGGGGGYGGGAGGYGGQGGYGGHNGYAAQDTLMSPAAATPTADANAQAYDANAQAAWAAYYAQNPEADPYVAYGGYQAYMNTYAQYYGYGQTQSPAPGAGAAAPPPPPPSEGYGAPPPPPPPAASPPNYGAVCVLED